MPKPRPHVTARQKKAFLSVYAEMGNISAACKLAGVGRRTHYDWIENDPEYRSQFEDSETHAVDLLELEARRRGAEGVNEPVIHQGQLMGSWVNDKGETVAPNTEGAKLIPLTVKKYSDTLLIFLLKAARPEKFRENTTVKHTGADGGPIRSETKVTHAIDYEALRGDLEQFAGRGAIAGRVPQNGN